MGNIRVEASIKGVAIVQTGLSEGKSSGNQSMINYPISHFVEDEDVVKTRMNIAREVIESGVVTTVEGSAVSTKTDTTATLPGSVTMAMPAAVVEFEVWEGSGDDPENSTLHLAAESPIAGDADPISVSYALTGLTAETNYSFRIVVTTRYRTIYSSAIHFTTDAAG